MADGGRQSRQSLLSPSAGRLYRLGRGGLAGPVVHAGPHDDRRARYPSVLFRPVAHQQPGHRFPPIGAAPGLVWGYAHHDVLLYGVLRPVTHPHRASPALAWAVCLCVLGALGATALSLADRQVIQWINLVRWVLVTLPILGASLFLAMRRKGESPARPEANPSPVSPDPAAEPAGWLAKGGQSHEKGACGNVFAAIMLRPRGLRSDPTAGAPGLRDHLGNR